MRAREYGDYIEDISDSIIAIEEFVKGMDFKDFTKDKKTVVSRYSERYGKIRRNIKIGCNFCKRDIL